jgi:hypothetical protein
LAGSDEERRKRPKASADVSLAPPSPSDRRADGPSSPPQSPPSFVFPLLRCRCSAVSAEGYAWSAAGRYSPKCRSTVVRRESRLGLAADRTSLAGSPRPAGVQAIPDSVGGALGGLPLMTAQAHSSNSTTSTSFHCCAVGVQRCQPISPTESALVRVSDGLATTDKPAAVSLFLRSSSEPAVEGAAGESVKADAADGSDGAAAFGKRVEMALMTSPSLRDPLIEKDSSIVYYVLRNGIVSPKEVPE